MANHVSFLCSTDFFCRCGKVRALIGPTLHLLRRKVNEIREPVEGIICSFATGTFETMVTQLAALSGGMALTDSTMVSLCSFKLSS